MIEEQKLTPREALEAIFKFAANDKTRMEATGLIAVYGEQLLKQVELGAAFAQDMPVNGCATRIDESTWALYETGRDMEDGNSFAYAKITE